MSPLQRKLEQTYASYREAARNLVEPRLLDLTNYDVTLTEINAAALKQATAWRSCYTGNRRTHLPKWDWEKVVEHYRRRPRRVELAIWVTPTLCGLVLGRISERQVVASIHFLEGNPTPHPLSKHVAAVAARYLDAIAVLAGCEQTAVMRPVPGLVNYYKNLGFVEETTRGKRVIRLTKTL